MVSPWKLEMSYSLKDIIVEGMFYSAYVPSWLSLPVPPVMQLDALAEAESTSPDSLAGSPLAKPEDGPLLFVFCVLTCVVV